MSGPGGQCPVGEEWGGGGRGRVFTSVLQELFNKS